jgi:hypothetical protein
LEIVPQYWRSRRTKSCRNPKLIDLEKFKSEVCGLTPNVRLRQVEPAQSYHAEEVDLKEPQPVLVGDFGKRFRLEDAEVINDEFMRLVLFTRVNVGRLVGQ